MTCQYLWGFLSTGVPVGVWLLGSVCLVLIWLYNLHQQRGFTLSRIFGLFIGWTRQTKSYLMSYVSENRKGSDWSRVWLEVYMRSFWMAAYVFAWVHVRTSVVVVSRKARIPALRLFGLSDCVEERVCDRNFRKVCLNLLPTKPMEWKRLCIYSLVSLLII